jgi:pimeloyl-ACP methyl ester carboxylesterase
VREVAVILAANGGAKPVVIGASLGGIAALLAQGEADAAGLPPLFAALVLVDITPRVDRAGIDKIQRFMRTNAREGFESVAEAVEAVAAYLPHRPRPSSHDGLKKNLRRAANGRWFWHWDPRFIEGPHSVDSRADTEDALLAAAKGLRQPALLVRGASSEVVQDAHAREFLELAPHAEYLDVGGAHHMVAGDRNDNFAAAILDFLARLDHRDVANELPSRQLPG